MHSRETAGKSLSSKKNIMNNFKSIRCWLAPKRVVNILKRCSKPIWLVAVLFTVFWFLYLPHAEKNYPKYYEDHDHRNWTFKISKNYEEHLLSYWTEPARLQYKSSIWTQGENATPFVPTNEEDGVAMEKLREENKYNIFASERISLHRSLPDFRYDECRVLSYPEKLPAVSIIIIFHNEAWSALLRTVSSVIDRSPRELVHEIILVDDASTWPHLKRPLDDYIELLPANIRIIRVVKREGLIRARLIGAKNATGSILTFLDAHIECTDGWLLPMVARIASDRSVVAVPIIDIISSTDMSFQVFDRTKINELRWLLYFDWKNIPKRELLRTKYDKTAPVRTPTLVGCAFSVDREFFFEIGSYDERMDIWGSENVELAFRVWMCGGSLEILPCSRIAHLFRLSTYSFNGDEETIMLRNSIRTVEVWMGEFKDLYYSAYPKAVNISAGDLTERKRLREHLKCKSFRWYLENLLPQSNWLKEYTMMGEVKNVANDMCLDIYPARVNETIIIFPCHGGGGYQFFAFEKTGQIVTVETFCVSIKDNAVILAECSEDDKSQRWRYDKEMQWIVHRESGKCMQTNETEVVMVGTCNSRSRWHFTSTWRKNLTLT